MKNLHQLRIVFMGTPDFAVCSLDELVKAGCHIVGVVTAPDKPAGRGMQLQKSAVKQYADGHQLKTLQPEKLKNPAFLAELSALKADLQIVVAFRMLPELVWNMPPMGTINLHASLLPQYRGAAPINWAIINGEKETGVTTFKLKQEIDTGNILLQERIPIGDNESAGELHDKMKQIGALLLIKTVKELADGTVNEKPQPVEGKPHQELLHSENHLKLAPKIFTETCKINFNQSTDEVHNLIRGLSPFPGAFTFLKEKMFKIYKSEKEITFDPNETTTRGHYKTDGKTFLKFSCSNGYIHCKEIQWEGKKRMNIEEFLRGFRE
jgi:methionyl-tRNA formyltransferase